jgi:hypothetical protein
MLLLPPGSGGAVSPPRCHLHKAAQQTGAVEVCGELRQLLLLLLQQGGGECCVTNALLPAQRSTANQQ